MSSLSPSPSPSSRSPDERTFIQKGTALDAGRVLLLCRSLVRRGRCRRGRDFAVWTPLCVALRLLSWCCCLSLYSSVNVVSFWRSAGHNSQPGTRWVTVVDLGGSCRVKRVGRDGGEMRKLIPVLGDTLM
jgi:hypothetical protein